MPDHLRHKPSADRLREFLAVAEAGNISEAARKLGLPRATLSRRMAGLEAALGIRLLLRRTTQVTLTHAGEELRQRAARLVADEDAAWDAVRRMDDTPRGLLRVSVTGPYFADLFAEFLQEFPEVRLEVQSTTQHVDLLSHGVDVALRIGPVRDPDLIVRHLHTDRLIAVASPEYLQRRGQLTTPDELTQHACLLGISGNWSPLTEWPLSRGGTVTVAGPLAANEIEHRKRAAMAGLGIALIASAVVSEELQDGRLVPVLEQEIGAELPVNLVYADREYMDPKIRAFIDRAVPVIQTQMPKPWDGLKPRT